MFESNLNYKNNILLGRAMIDACVGEHKAAPFGIFLDPSATNNGHFSADWKWFKSHALKIDKDLVDDFVKNLNDYFKEMRKQAPSNYPLKKIDEHSHLAEEYFAGGQ